MARENAQRPGSKSIENVIHAACGNDIGAQLIDHASSYRGWEADARHEPHSVARRQAPRLLNSPIR
ncbi:MAG: hypothetical protein HOC05_12645 [Gemmatimonadetes bacterium]|nr:hypothetical protein [Gemmatimonadota bacterium]